MASKASAWAVAINSKAVVAARSVLIVHLNTFLRTIWIVLPARRSSSEPKSLRDRCRRMLGHEVPGFQGAGGADRLRNTGSITSPAARPCRVSSSASIDLDARSGPPIRDRGTTRLLDRDKTKPRVAAPSLSCVCTVSIRNGGHDALRLSRQSRFNSGVVVRLAIELCLVDGS